MRVSETKNYEKRKNKKRNTLSSFFLSLYMKRNVFDMYIVHRTLYGG